MTVFAILYAVSQPVSTWSLTVPRSLRSDTVIVLRDRDSQHVYDP